MICTTIQNKGYEQILEILEHCEMAEIRLDNCQLSLEEISDLFTVDVPLVATCRISGLIAGEPSLRGEMTEESRGIKAASMAQKRLLAAVEAGADYVDVEMEAPKYMSKTVRASAHENGTVFIRSVHDFEKTPSEEELRDLFDRCVYHGADMVKIATMAGGPDDVARVMSLYDHAEEKGKGLLAFCMGDAGRASRYECLLKGAPYTYAALDAGEAAAPGQIPAAEMAERIYGGFRFIATGEGKALPMPCSKSFAQRAVIAAALASGESVLSGYSICGDNEAAIEVARSLGAEVSVEGDVLRIHGIGASVGCRPLPHLHVGESGLLTRIMIPLAAQLSSVPCEITGEKTLVDRPLKGAGLIMKEFGVDLPEDCHVPVTVQGPLGTGKAGISGKYGSQLVSGLLMSAPLSQKNTTVTVAEPKSIPYMYITLDVLKKFGIKIANDMLGGRDFVESGGDWGLCTELVFRVRGGQTYKPAQLVLEGDWSAAANFLVAGAVFGKVEISGLDTTSLQADLSIMDVLMEAGASLSQMDGDRGNITVQRAPLNSFGINAEHCPDLFPALAVLAAFCQGTSRIGGVSRLKHKESDRGEAILQMLTQLGVPARVEEDVMVIEGMTLVQRLLSGKLLKGGLFLTHHDHRMAMALRVASLGADSPVILDDEACMGKSFPAFKELFETLI